MKIYTVSLLAAFMMAAILAPVAVTAQLDLANTKHDTSQPIDISADELVVKQEERMAVFRGNVQVNQGDVQMVAKVMKVFYHEQEQGEQAALSKISAKGGVEIDMPGKHAQGDRGEYDVDAGLVLLEGNVELQRGLHTMYGDKFTYDVRQGHSKLTSQGDDVPERPMPASMRSQKKAKAGGNATTPRKSGRVRAFLMPKKPRK